MNDEVRINLNEPVKFKLTDKGKEIYYHQYDEFNKGVLNRGCVRAKIKPHFPREDAEGYTVMQLWKFMNLYGPYMTIGSGEEVIKPLEIIYTPPEQEVKE